MSTTNQDENTKKEWDDIELRAIHLKNALSAFSEYAYYCLEEEDEARGLIYVIKEHAQNLCNDIINKNFEIV